MDSYHFLAFDLGAESGRAVLGTLEGERLSLRQVSRFPNAPVLYLGHLHWNLLGLFEEMKRAVKSCVDSMASGLQSLAVDTWGVDFGLLGRDGSLLGMPYSYRDQRTKGAMEEFLKLVPREKIYELTGIQFMPFNTIFQLFAMAREKSPLLKSASDLLFMPDLCTYLFSGERATEFTIATTSQLYNPRRREWDLELLEAVGIPKKIMREVIPPGTVVGSALPAVARETGIGEIPVVATASHDTGAAVAAAPALGEDWAYISSGTWSLVGIEAGSPIISGSSLEHNFTNEGGMEGTWRFLKNVTGLWLIQQCRKKWAQEEILSYDQLMELAAFAPAFRSLIDPDDPDFLNPPDMPAAIELRCRITRQPIPRTPGEFVRSILESLSLKYRAVLEELRGFAPRPPARIHMIGGGSRNRLLCQFAADATGLPVIAGPAEATAVGNIMGQARALGYVTGLDQIRRIVRNSTEMDTYEPRENDAWDLAYERFQDIINRARRGIPV